jgi:hypothetical protein
MTINNIYVITYEYFIFKCTFAIDHNSWSNKSLLTAVGNEWHYVTVSVHIINIIDIIHHPSNKQISFGPLFSLHLESRIFNLRIYTHFNKLYLLLS